MIFETSLESTIAADYQPAGIKTPYSRPTLTTIGPVTSLTLSTLPFGSNGDGVYACKREGGGDTLFECFSS